MRLETSKLFPGVIWPAKGADGARSPSPREGDVGSVGDVGRWSSNKEIAGEDGADVVGPRRSASGDGAGLDGGGVWTGLGFN